MTKIILIYNFANYFGLNFIGLIPSLDIITTIRDTYTTRRIKTDGLQQMINLFNYNTVDYYKSRLYIFSYA